MPSAPAGDNPAGRTRGFNLKIATQYPPAPGAPPSTDQSAAVAAPPALARGPSHQLSAGPLSTVATATQAVVSSADSSAGLQLVSGDPAALGRRGLGALPRTPVPQREQLEELGDNELPGGSEHGSLVDQPLRFSPLPRPSSPREQASRAEDLAAMTGTPLPRGFGSGRSSFAAPQSDHPSRMQSPSPAEQEQQQLAALRLQQQQIENEIRAAHQERQSLEAELADKRKSLDDAEVRAKNRRTALQQEQNQLQVQADNYRRECSAELDRLWRERRDFQAQLDRDREVHDRDFGPSSSDARVAGPQCGRFPRYQPPQQARLLPARPRISIDSFAAQPAVRPSNPFASAASSLAAQPPTASAALSLAVCPPAGSATPPTDLFGSSRDDFSVPARYSSARYSQAPPGADDALPARPPLLRPPPQPPPASYLADSRGPRAAFASSLPSEGVVRDLHPSIGGTGAPRRWHQLEGDGDNELADQQNLRAHRDRGLSSLDLQFAVDSQLLRAPYARAWAPARPSLERISERPSEDKSRAAFAATVGVPPPPECLGRSPSPHSFFRETADDDGARAVVPRGGLPPWPNYLAAAGSLDDSAPQRRPSTQDAIDRVRRDIEAARIEEARLSSLLGAPSAQAVPVAPSLALHASSPVYANAPVTRPSATTLYANAKSLDPTPAARPLDQAAPHWQPGAHQSGVPSAWLAPLPPPQLPPSSFGAIPQFPPASYSIFPPPPPRIQASFPTQNLRSAHVYDTPTSAAFPSAPPPLPPPPTAPPQAPPPPSGPPTGDGCKGGAASAPRGGPGDPDDPDKKRRDKDIDDKRKGQFPFDSAALKAASGKSRGSMKCEVPPFERGKDITIQDWIYQIETYFTIGNIPPESFVGFIYTKIAPQHLNEIKQYRSLDYLPFREKLIEVFEEPDLATAHLNSFANLAQTQDETISEYMRRARLLALKAHPDLLHVARERILVTHFLLGLYDHQLASSLAVVKIATSAEAERLAAEGEAVRRDQKPRRFYNNFLPEEACGESPDDEDEYYPDPEYPDDEDGDLTAALPAAGANQRVNPAGRPGERRKATTTTRCYGCQQYGHYRSECPRARHSNSVRPQARFPLECILCKGPHRVRDCTLLPTCQQVARSSQPRDSEPARTASQPRPSAPVAARPAAPNEPNATFKRDGTAVLHDSMLADESPPLAAAQPPCEPSSPGGLPSASESPVHVIDPALPAMSEESTPGTPRMQLFFVLGAVQTLPVWVLADSGSVRNLIDESVYNRLPFKPPIRDPGDVQVIGGNGEALNLKGFAVLPVSLGTNLIWHEFGIVSNLPLEVLVGADVLAPHLCSLLYLKNNKKRLHFGISVCPRCTQFRGDPEVGSLKQLRFVDNHPKRKRNRLKISSQFLATLPEATCDESDSEPLETIEESPESLDLSPSVELPSIPSGSDNSPDQKALDSSIPAEIPNQTPSSEPAQTGKLQKILADLKIATLPIPESLRRRLICLVRSNLDAFAATATDLGRTSVVVHTIKTGDAKPFRHKLNAVPFARRQYLEQEVDKLLSIGAISPADPGACPYASRTVITPKKDGSMRMCVDYRDINSQTEKDSFPLPRIDQVWPTLSRARYFASLDLLMGFHQVEVDPRDRAKTAFLTHHGLFIYNVMPFGLCNAPATFQRLMERVLGTLIRRGVLVYIDDVLIYAETPEQLIEILSTVLQLLIQAGLKCKASKCSLFTESLSYLGHVVSRDGIKYDPNKLEKIKLWPRPEKGVQLASFLGLCNYYRDLIPSFAQISDPVYKVSRADIIEWTFSLDESFEALKQQLLQPRIVRLPDPDKPFVLETDGSRIALGAVLKQRFEETGLEHPVGFYSRALSGSERNYAAYEVELYAVVRAVEHFRMFLLGKEFLLRTDHAALRNLLRRDLPPTTRVERWILRLSEYTFKIAYQKGQDNVIADVLSRLPFASAQSTDQSSTSSLCRGPSTPIQSEPSTSNSPEQPSEVALPITSNFSEEASSEYEYDQSDSDDDPEPLDAESLSNFNCWNERAATKDWPAALEGDEDNFSFPILDLPISRDSLNSDSFSIPTAEEFSTAQAEDSELKQVRQWLDKKQSPSADALAPLSDNMKIFAQLFDELSLHDSVIVLRRSDDPKRELILLPSSLTERIIRFYHEGPGGSHQAAKATSSKIIRRFFWPHLKRDVRLYVACCPTCERFLRLGRTPRAALTPMEVGGRGDCIAMDIVGGKDSLPETPRGNKYILTIIDCFTRYAIAIPIPDQSSSVIISATVGNYITLYGTPRRILTDQGRNFLSSEFSYFCNFFRIHKLQTTSYHPQSNGICERFNQSLKSGLRKVVHESLFSSWDLYLNFVVFSYNLSVHSSTGFTPFYLTFGSEARLPPDLIFGAPSTDFNIKDAPQRGALSALLRSFSVLSASFRSVRENLQSFHQREKDYYDLGAVSKIFKPGDFIRVRLKSKRKAPSKFLSDWSGPHQVISVKGVVVEVKELSSNRIYRIHHDRLSNPLFSNVSLKSVSGEIPETENSVPLEEHVEPGEDLAPISNPDEALVRSRFGRVIKSTRRPDFDYVFMLPSTQSLPPSSSSSYLEGHSQFFNVSNPNTSIFPSLESYY